MVTAAAHLNIEIEYRIDSCFVRLVQRDALPRSSTPSLRLTKFTDAESKTERRDGGKFWARNGPELIIAIETICISLICAFEIRSDSTVLCRRAHYSNGMDEREGVGRVRAPSFVTTPSLVPPISGIRARSGTLHRRSAPSAALSLPSLGQLVRGNVPLPIPGCVSKSVNMNQGRMEGKRKERQQNLNGTLTLTTLRSILERVCMNKLKWIRRICHSFSSEQCFTLVHFHS